MGINVLVIIPFGEGAVLCGKTLATGIVLPARAIAVAAPIADRARSPGKGIVIGEDTTPFAHRYVMRGVEGAGRYVAETSDHLPLIGRTQSVTAILYEPQIVLLHQFHDNIEIVRVAQRMGEEYSTGLGTDRVSKSIWIYIIGTYIDIDEHGYHSILDDRIQCRRKPRRDRNDLVAWLQCAIA